MPKVTEPERKFLEELRDSGKINMMSAIPYLQREFGYSEKLAQTILMNWIKKAILAAIALFLIRLVLEFNDCSINSM